MIVFRNIVLDGLCEYLTEKLISQYGKGRLVTRDATLLNEDVQGEQTPRILILEEERSRENDITIGQAKLNITLLCLIRRRGFKEALIQSELNTLEAFLDTWLAHIKALGKYVEGTKTNNVPCVVIQLPSQTTMTYAGENEGWLQYSATIIYPLNYE